MMLLTGAAARAAEPVEVLADRAAAALAQGQFADAERMLGEALAVPDLPSDRRASLLNDQGLARWRLGDSRGAIQSFNEAVTLLPELASAYNNRGNVLLGLGQTAEAEKDFERAILLAPNYVAAINNRAIASMQRGEYEKAIEDFGRAAALAPTSPGPVSGRGQARLMLGHTYAAIRDFSRALALDPSYRSGYRNRAESKMRLDLDEEAIADLNAALEVAPDDPGLLLARGKAQIAVKAYAGAMRDLTRAAELDPKLAAAFAERGHVLALMGDHEKAAADFTAALAIDTRQALTYVYRAWTEMKRGQPELGLTDIDRALKLDPENPEAFETRGQINEALGRLDAAVADYRQAVNLGLDSDDIWTAIERLTGEGRPPPREIAGGEFEDWLVYVDVQERYFAMNERLGKLRVPLETYGNEAPRLLDWEMKKSPFKGVGVLRYRAGKLGPPDKAEEIEMAAIVDVSNGRVVSLEPYRQGQKLAVWTWEGGTVNVKGPDGVTSEFKLRAARQSKRPLSAARQPQTLESLLFGDNGDAATPPSYGQRKTVAQKKRKKTKSIFDLFFQ
jgi:tetratricopeptide (TPR) repeat protein